MMTTGIVASHLLLTSATGGPHASAPASISSGQATWLGFPPITALLSRPGHAADAGNS